ncbi:MAG: metallophosphoesterase [Candidatus Thorarchaeota archaeon]|nr:metallophosphoesterase [Candidatus Thorarchaeota archaeon]
MSDPLMVIFHMSDIHIGEHGVYLDDLRRVITEVERASDDIASPFLLITGDLTTDGLQEEYEAFHDAISGISIPFMILPGNHDERNYGAAHFERLFGSRFKTFTNESIALYGADSAEPDNDAGHVGREHYPQIREFFEQAGDRIKIFALHHHLVPVPHTGREYNVVEDAGDVLGVLEDTGCSLVLNGHRHVPWMWRLNDMILYNSGTLLSRRIRGATIQAYTRIELFADRVSFTLCQKDGTHRLFAQSILR